MYYVLRVEFCQSEWKEGLGKGDDLPVRARFPLFLYHTMWGGRVRLGIPRGEHAKHRVYFWGWCSLLLDAVWSLSVLHLLEKFLTM